MLSGLTVEELKARAATAASGSARVSTRSARRAGRVDRRDGEGHAGRAGRRAVHAQGAGCSSSKLDGYRLLAARTRRRARCCSRATATTTRRRLSRDRAGRRGAAVRATASSTARWSCSTATAARAFSGSSGAAKLQPADRHPPCHGLSAGHLLRVRPARLRGFRPARAAARSARRSCSRELHPARGRAAVPRSRRASRARCSTSRSSALRLEGIIAKKADAPYKAGRSPHWLKIRSQQDGRLRRRGLHGAEGLAAAASARCSSPSTWTAR